MTIWLWFKESGLWVLSPAQETQTRDPDLKQVGVARPTYRDYLFMKSINLNVCDESDSYCTLCSKNIHKKNVFATVILNTSPWIAFQAVEHISGLDQIAVPVSGNLL